MPTGVWACLVETVLQLQFLLPRGVKLTKIPQHNEPLLSGKQELQKKVGEREHVLFPYLFNMCNSERTLQKP